VGAQGGGEDFLHYCSRRTATSAAQALDVAVQREHTGRRRLVGLRRSFAGRLLDFGFWHVEPGHQQAAAFHDPVAIDGIEYLLALFAGVDQLELPEHAQMVGDGGLGGGERFHLKFAVGMITPPNTTTALDVMARSPDRAPCPTGGLRSGRGS